MEAILSLPRSGLSSDFEEPFAGHDECPCADLPEGLANGVDPIGGWRDDHQGERLAPFDATSFGPCEAGCDGKRCKGVLGGLARPAGDRPWGPSRRRGGRPGRRQACRSSLSRAWAGDAVRE